MLFLVLGTVAVATIFYQYFYKPFNYWKDRGVEQGNPKYIFGHFWKSVIGKKDGSEIFEDVYRQGGPNARYTGMYQFSKPVLMIRDPQLLKTITVKDFDSFINHTKKIEPDMDILWDKNLLNLRDQKWRDVRTVLSPSFTSSKMRNMYTLMTQCAENTVQHLLQNKEQTATLNLKDVLSRFTNDVIASTAFGLEVDSWKEPNNIFYEICNDSVKRMNNTFKLILYWLLPPLKYVMSVKVISDEANVFARNLIDETIKVREEKGIVRPDMLHLLLQTRNNLRKQQQQTAISNGSAKANHSNNPMEITNEDITAHAMIFITSGFDTVSSFLCYTTYEIAVNPDIQEKLREEIRATKEKCEGNATYEDIQEMKYMDMVVSETLRKWPHFVFTDRECSKPYTIEPEGPGEKPLRLEKGAELLIPIYSIHHDPKYYSDPERFDPERFSDENKGKIQPYTYIPFGLGPRNCIGSRFSILETKILLFHLLSSFELVPVEKTTIPLKFLKHALFNKIPTKGFWIGFKKLSCKE